CTAKTFVSACGFGLSAESVTTGAETTVLILVVGNCDCMSVPYDPRQICHVENAASLRYLPVQPAWTTWRPCSTDGAPLRSSTLPLPSASAPSKRSASPSARSPSSSPSPSAASWSPRACCCLS